MKSIKSHAQNASPERFPKQFAGLIYRIDLERACERFPPREFPRCFPVSFVLKIEFVNYAKPGRL